jgi:hypothetical protein
METILFKMMITMQMELMKWIVCCGISWHHVKSSIFGKWQMRHKLMNMDWFQQWLASHEQEEIDSGLALIKY